MLADASASTGAIICAPLISAAPSSAEAGAGTSSVSGRQVPMKESINLRCCLWHSKKLSDLPAAQLRRAVRFRRQTATTNVGESYPRDPDHRASDSCGDDESRRSDTPMRACKSGRKLRMAILIEAPMH